MSLLAHCASLSLDAVQRVGFGREDALAPCGELAKAMPHDMSRYWQPTVANYLGRVSKERILEAVREGAGEDSARHIADLKKQAMAHAPSKCWTGKAGCRPRCAPLPLTTRELRLKIAKAEGGLRPGAVLLCFAASSRDRRSC